MREDREKERRGKISVNLLRLVWEFEEGGEVGEKQRERGRKREKQGVLRRKHKAFPKSRLSL